MQILAKIQTNRFTISWTVPPSKLWHLWTKDHPTSSPLYDFVASRQLHIDTNHPHHGASVLASPKHIYEISTKVTKKFMHFLSCSIFIQYKSIYFNYETLFLNFTHRYSMRTAPPFLTQVWVARLAVTPQKLPVSMYICPH
jgi:hypothetical protein